MGTAGLLGCSFLAYGVACGFREFRDRAANRAANRAALKRAAREWSAERVR
jgi:hypothetical protein